MSKSSVVAVVQVKDSVEDAVREAMELASWKQHLQKGKPTSLKVNLGWDLFIPGSITSPWVIEAVIKTIQEWVGTLYIVEADQVLENIEKAFYKAGLDELCKRYKVQWINMTSQKTRIVPVPNGKIFPQLEIPEILLETQVITIPVMKTHAKTVITGAIKNQWGCISKMRHNHHLVLTDALADINSVVRPAFVVMDATIGLEGNGPKSGAPKLVNRILATPDIVACDTIQAKIMGLDPSKIAHVNACAERCLGTNKVEEIQLKGEENVAQLNLQFVPAKHNLVSRLEELLRRSRWKWLFFDSPIFYLMLLGAKVWYFIWCYLGKGRVYWKEILNHPFYGPEWRAVKGTDRA